MKRILVLFLVGLVLFSVAEARQYGDVTIPDTLEAGGETLVLNGAGYRSKFFMKMYLGGLYLKQESSDASAIVSADEPMLIKLHIVSGKITSDRMTDAINEGFEKSAGANLSSLKDEIDKFKSFFAEEIKVDDIFDIAYVPGEGVSVYKNETLSGTIEGLDFKNAAFGIWLGDKPADKGLKKNMLGED
jgi:hypothetical protein